MRTTLKIPTHVPTPSVREAQTPVTSRTQLPLEGEAMRVMGINPGIALQHPGFYYYMAARCTERRRQRYLVAADAEVRLLLKFCSTF
jgi:trafficking protein particle complex subunit 11